jgi:hypothetical protein
MQCYIAINITINIVRVSIQCNTYYIVRGLYSIPRALYIYIHTGYMRVQWNQGSGLGPRPAPFPHNTTAKFKYNIPRLRNKEQTTDSWLVECL